MRNIVQAGDPILRQKAADVPISSIQGQKIKKLIKEMISLLSKEEYGVALAAPQVGEPIRLFVVSGRALARGARNAPDEPVSRTGLPKKVDALSPPDPSRSVQAEEDLVYINPELLKLSRRKVKKHEGCLSIRGKWGEVLRSEKASVRAYGENGTRFTRGASGFLAHIFQHELDHLDGILYTDKAVAMYEEKNEQP